MPKQKITKREVDNLLDGQTITDSEIKGFVVRRRANVVKFGYRYSAKGQQRWLEFATFGEITVEQARVEAKKLAGEVAGQADPVGEAQQGLGTVTESFEQFVTIYLQSGRLRSASEYEKILRRLVLPRIGQKKMLELKRRDITAMLDGIASERGPVMADRTLAHVRKWFRWQSARDEAFSTPIVPGMNRTNSSERARDRVLDDAEIRDLWQALQEIKGSVPDCYPAYVWTLLLTGQRRTNVATMHLDEIERTTEHTTWLIPKARLKTKIDHAVPLSRSLVGLLGDRLAGPFVFGNDNDLGRPFSGYSKSKAVLDAKIKEIRKRDGRKPMPDWTLHDLRRTARTLLSRAGVLPDHAERILAHKIPGVRGVYDRHAYLDEKAEALEKLAALVYRIITPEPDHTGSVVPFARRS